MLLNRVILKYCAEEAGKEAFACARTPRLRLRLSLSLSLPFSLSHTLMRELPTAMTLLTSFTIDPLLLFCLLLCWLHLLYLWETLDLLLLHDFICNNDIIAYFH